MTSLVPSNTPSTSTVLAPTQASHASAPPASWQGSSVARRDERRDVRMAPGPAGTVTLAGRELFLGGAGELIDAIEALLPAREVHTVITPNVDQTLTLRTDEALGLAYDEATIRITDGFPLVVLGHRLGAHRLERLTGADLLPLAAQVAAERGWRIALTGGGPGVAAHAAAVLRDSTDADVVAVDFPRVSDVDDRASLEVVEALASLEPDLVFVCLGSPKQDVWVSRWRAKLPPAVYIGAGAAVDFVAGTKRRAPRALQRLGLEWAFRLAQEPRRLARRYLVRGPAFAMVAVRSLIAARRSR